MSEEKKTGIVLLKSLQKSIPEKIKQMEANQEIKYPKNYSPDNALKSAFLEIQQTQDKNYKPALDVCTEISIANSLLDMVIQGLSPSKKQGYFIVRGNKLCFDRSYFGTVAVLKRLVGVISVFGQPIFEGDVVEYHMEEARKIIDKHEQKFENIDINKLTGAYCTIMYKDSTGEIKQYSEIMTKAQIDKSWEKSPSRDRKIHKDTPDQMAIRTVLNRGCKLFINSSDDSDLDLVVQAFNRTDGREEHEDANTGDILDLSGGVVIDNPPDPDPDPDPDPNVDPNVDPNSINFGE